MDDSQISHERWVYKDITELHTPVGYFSVTCGEEKLPFSVAKSTFDWTCDEGELYIRQTENGPVTDSIVIEAPDTNYIILIDPCLLVPGCPYTIRFTCSKECKWEYGDADEYTECYDTIIDDWAVGIGDCDPNQQKIDWQLAQRSAQSPYAIDETGFSGYTTEVLDSLDGFTFKKFDDSEPIQFWVAWIKADKFPPEKYAGALSLWLC